MSTKIKFARTLNKSRRMVYGVQKQANTLYPFYNIGVFIYRGLDGGHGETITQITLATTRTHQKQKNWRRYDINMMY